MRACECGDVCVMCAMTETDLRSILSAAGDSGRPYRELHQRRAGLGQAALQRVVAVILYNPNFFESVDIPVSWDQIRGWPVRPSRTRTRPPPHTTHHRTRTVCLTPVKQAGNKSALVRDLWKHENQGVWSVGFLGKRVEAHAVRFITVTPYSA